MAVVKARHPKRGEVHLIGLDPTRGREIQKTRPCVIISPDELNAHLQTVIVAPLTSSGKAYPCRVPCVFDKKHGLIVLDQIRTVDRERLLRRLGAVSEAELDSTLALLREMFEAGRATSILGGAQPLGAAFGERRFFIIPVGEAKFEYALEAKCCTALGAADAGQLGRGSRRASNL